MSFPSVVFMDEQGEVIQSIVGYKSPEEFERILTYFAELLQGNPMVGL